MTTVVFDLGVVLSDEGDLIEVHGERLGVPADLLARAYWADRRAYDDGQDDLTYWGNALRPLGIDVDADLATELAELDSLMWTDIRPEAKQILRDLRERAIPVYVLSNAPATMARFVEASDWRPLVDGYVVSGVIGHSKPSPAIFRALEELSGARPADIRFIDDRAENIRGAQACGWNAHLWVDDADTRAWLMGLGLL